MDKSEAMSMDGGISSSTGKGFSENTSKSAAESAKLVSAYQRLKRPVFLLSLSILRDYSLAEDIMQQTFLQAMEHAKSFRIGSNEKAWVMSIAHNLALNCLKKRGHEEIGLDSFLKTETGEEQDMTSSAEFVRALSLLDEQERAVVTLKAVCGFRHAQIAKIAGITVADSRAKYSRALKKLRKYYLESDFQV